MASREYSTENISWGPISATPATFQLRGGNYSLQANATWGGGSVTLSRLSGDGSTFVSTGMSLTANGMVVQNLPYGTYQLTIATATSVYADVAAIVTTN